MNLFTKYRHSAGLLLFCLVASNAWAQQAQKVEATDSTIEKLLEEIKVVSQRPGHYQKIDRQVYKADQFQSAKGGSAIDVIRNMPSVSVNGQGEISVRGSSGFLVLINGKPVQADAETVLSQLPANSIENVELITTPSAKYDPDGRGGIINITTKKGVSDGISGQLNIQGGLPAVHRYDNKRAPQRYGGDVAINFKKQAWELSASLSYLRNDAGGKRVGDVNTTIDSVFTSFPSEGERSFKRYNYAARITASYSPSKNSSFSVGLYNGQRFQARTADIWYRNRRTDLRTQTLMNENIYFNANLQTKEGSFNLGNLDYIHTFPNKSALSISLLYEYANLYGNTKNLNVRHPATKDTIQYTYNTTKNPVHGYRANIGYSSKLGAGVWEGGYQFRYDDQDGRFVYQTLLLHTGDYVTDPLFSNHVLTQNQIHSLYSQYGGKWKNLEYNGGLRYEYATRSLRLAKDEKERTLILSNLFPSASILYSFQNKWKLKGGYSRRIKRTNNFELNPFPEREHSETLEQGDPELLPEYIGLSEAGVIKEVKTGSYFITFYNQQVKNPIQRVNDVYNDTILKRVFTNAGKATLWGMEGGATVKPVQWWQLYVGANVYDYHIKGSIFGGNIGVNNSSVVYSINTTSTFQLTPTLNWQWSLNYLSQRATAQGEDSRFFSPNTSLKKTFWKGRLSATVQWQNIDLGMLNANQQRITTYGSNFYTTTNYIYETDVFLVHLSLNLNGLTKKLKLPTSEFGEKEF